MDAVSTIVSTVTTHTRAHAQRNTHTLLLDLLHGAGRQLPLQGRWRDHPVLVHGDKKLPVDVQSGIKYLKVHANTHTHTQIHTTG